MAEPANLGPGQILTGPLFDEPMRVETVRPQSRDAWVVGLVGLQSERFRSVTLASVGCQRGALPRAIAELLGFDRTPAGLAEFVATAVDSLVEERRLQASGPNVYLP